MALSPRESGKFVASLGKNVKIKDDGVKKLGDLLVSEIESGKLSSENFSQVKLHPKSDDPKALDWLFVVDTLNFCFWHLETETGWTVEGYTGYFALCAAINRALKEKVDILNPKYYSEVSEKDLAKIFRSDNDVPIPLLQERVKCLHEVGNVLLENFDGSFENCVKKADNSAATLLDLIVNNFKCFKDEATYKDKKIAIYKRAQILIGDIWACFHNEGIGHFKDIDEITMFADYRIPQTLLYFGVFEYSEDLKKKLQDNKILENGEEDEVEIRACSIHAVELLKEHANKKLTDKKINAILIDHFLWDFRREHNKEIVEKKLPFHKTFSIYY
ncbi:queuosine salvage protein [Tribolium madens]|uniref:queuosine salvage protein n=1 Tax=Tribolium madens TaxID=41895 RepID=UPI001CF724A3|nr:queuosine salvage protein [Tribolium madens]